MSKLPIVILLLTLSILNVCYAKPSDTYNKKNDSLKNEIKILKDRTDEIRIGQLNYSIEKDLLKETYNVNYEKLNLLITVGLGIVGILTFLGIRDINSIKKDFKSELDAMKSLKSEFENKSNNFDVEKERFDSEIKKIITQNEEQNKKIKVLELKEKIKKLMDDKQNTAAYEYCTVALELTPDDPNLLTNKAILQCRLNNFSEAVEIFSKIYLIDSKNTTYAGNYIESLYFINKTEKAKELIEVHSEYFREKKESRVLMLFTLIDNYFNLGEDDFKKYAESVLDFSNMESTKKHIVGWDLLEALYFASYQPTSNKKTICQNLLWYLDGIQSTRVTAEKIRIPIPPKA